MTDDPLILLSHDRSEARRANDPLVDRCVLGTVDRNGHAALRTLVLREIDDRLALFYNRTSTKHVELMDQRHHGSLLIYLPSVGVQYRFESRFEDIPREVIEEHWQLKPDVAKRMDSIYERHPQSTIIDDFAAFETLFAATVPPRKSPRNGCGVYVVVEVAERLELRTDPQMHDRRIYKREGNDWRVHQLVP
ncbi:MAG: pyridoxamine 5'-phosphate oxidase family protein [Gammaproteobacteria bacterium]|nr:pyridoxamine 5'-phosphate oxidase family protein [Gammaproteobacteria bacterium]